MSFVSLLDGPLGRHVEERSPDAVVRFDIVRETNQNRRSGEWQT